MKKNILFVLLFACAYLQAQVVPQAFKYQAVARDINGNEIKNKTINFRVSILTGSTVGVSVYTETHSITTNDFGVANLTVGDGTVVSGVFANIDWGANSHFLKIEMDASAGTNYQLMGTSQLLSVPYALYAGKSGGVTFKTGPGLSSKKDSIWLNTPAKTDTLWQWKSAGKINYWGNVGIGITPGRKLDIMGAPTDAIPGVFRLRAKPGNTTGNTNFTGISSTFTGSGGNGFNYAISGSSYGNNALSSNNPFNVGVAGFGDSSEYVNRGVGGVAKGINCNSNQGVLGRADGASSTENIGVYGYAVNNSGNNIAVLGVSDGSSGVNYGVFGKAVNSSTANYAGYFDGDVNITGNLTYPSDQRLKQNIKPFTGALDIVNALYPKTYEFNPAILGPTNLPKGLQYGLIAQEVEKVLPELVKNNVGFLPNSNMAAASPADVNGGSAGTSYTYKSVNYNALIPIVLQAIKEQQAQIELLKQQNAQLQDQLNKVINK